MRIDVRTPTGRFDEQTRAYAEFRAFAALARFSRDIDGASVTLTRRAGATRLVVCAVSVTFPGGARLHVTERGRHAYHAINRAVDRVDDLLREERPGAPRPHGHGRQPTTTTAARPRRQPAGSHGPRGGEDEECDVNLYRSLGDAIDTVEARDLAAQLIVWHDAMVKHVRAAGLPGAACDDDCPHGQARWLWTQALDVFGDDAARLSFLRTHGARPLPGAINYREEIRP